MAHPFQIFDQVRIINLVDRADRRREMVDQLGRLGGWAPNISFFEAHRPGSPGEFPSLGARGCFESHLAVLEAAYLSGCQSLLILEDDFDFSRDGLARMAPVLSQLLAEDWALFYGAHVLPTRGREGLIRIDADEPVLTTSFVAFNGPVIPEITQFLEAMLLRPAGSPDYGPMHVDGAYTVFRSLNPQYTTFAAFPSLGRQRSSPSDISPRKTPFERWKATRIAVSTLRKGYNWWQRLR